jgi:hypothetical protein
MAFRVLEAETRAVRERSPDLPGLDPDDPDA